MNIRKYTPIATFSDWRYRSDTSFLAVKIFPVMAIITPGDGATFQGVTAESQAINAIAYLQLRESIAIANPTGEDRINGGLDINTKLFTGSYRIPASQTINTSGQLVISATPYLDGGSFTPGIDGTFKSTSIEAYLLEVLMYLQYLESLPTKNPNNLNYVTGNYNADQKTYSGNFTLPFDLSIDSNGDLSVESVEYLLT